MKEYDFNAGVDAAIVQIRYRKRDASFDDSIVGNGEHSANEENILLELAALKHKATPWRPLKFNIFGRFVNQTITSLEDTNPVMVPTKHLWLVPVYEREVFEGDGGLYRTEWAVVQ